MKFTMFTEKESVMKKTRKDVARKITKRFEAEKARRRIRREGLSKGELDVAVKVLRDTGRVRVVSW